MDPTDTNDDAGSGEEHESGNEIEAQDITNKNKRLISILLNQATDILRLFRCGTCIEGDSYHGYTITDPETFADALKKSEALVNYFNSFILKQKSDKITEVTTIGRYPQPRMKKYYGHLCFAVGLLNTIATECKWKKIPTKITAKRQVNALVVAIVETRELSQYATDSALDVDKVLVQDRKKRRALI